MRGRPPKVDIASLREMLAAGLYVADAAARFGCTEGAIRMAARRNGIRLKKAPKHLAALKDAAAAGLTQIEAAKLLAIHPSSVGVLAKKHGVALAYRGRGVGKKAPDARAYRMAAMYRDGYTLHAIGEQYGVTRERVRQILTKHFGIRAGDGGSHAVAEKKRARRQAALEARTLRKWGCTFDQYRSLLAKRRPTVAFRDQKNNAANRGIGWELTLWQWWTIWQQSGKWEQRGRGQGYVMCRKGDVGPYAVGNVFIATARENSSEKSTKKSGLPIGVSFKKIGNYEAYIAKRCFNGKSVHLGSFRTPELAHAAYLAAEPPVARAA